MVEKDEVVTVEKLWSEEFNPDTTASSSFIFHLLVPYVTFKSSTHWYRIQKNDIDIV